MRKATATTTRRSGKEKRKDDDDVQQVQNLAGISQADNQQQHQQVPADLNQATTTRQQQSHQRDRDEQFPPTDNVAQASGNTKISKNVTGQDQRKAQSDEAALQTKNYRLAKELSEIRVRHREECKHVTRLTMENMNLASRCREAMSHVAIIKKELSLQKKKAAEAIALQQKLSDQLAALLGKEQSPKVIVPYNTEESTLEPTLENEKTTKLTGDNNDDNKDNINPRVRIVSEENPVIDNIPQTTNIKTKKNDGPNRSSKSSSPKSSSPMLGVTDVAAELDRMDQILAEHQGKTSQFMILDADESSSSHMRKSLENSSAHGTNTRKLSRESRKHLSIVEAVIQNQQPSSQTLIPSSSSALPADLDESEHKCDDYLELLTTQLPTLDMITKTVLKTDAIDKHDVPVSTEASESAPTVHLISSDEYEDSNVETDDNETRSQHVIIEDTSESISKADDASTDDQSLKESETKTRQRDSPKSARKTYFPYSASPKLDLPMRGTTTRNNYNEEFPEDISPAMRKASLDRKHRMPSRDQLPPDESEEVAATTPSSSGSLNKDNKSRFRNGRNSTNLISSIDAFEASFNAQFPDSFALKEASIAEESESEGGPVRKSDYTDIYDPFSTSPVRTSTYNSSEALSEIQHQGFLKESALPLLLSQQPLEGTSEHDTVDRQPLLGFKPRNDAYFGYDGQEKKTAISKDIGQSSTRNRQFRKPKFFDPPGKDRTSPRAQQAPAKPSFADYESNSANTKNVPNNGTNVSIEQHLKSSEQTISQQSKHLKAITSANSSISSSRQHDFLDGKVRTVPVGQTASPKIGTLVNRSALNGKVSPEKETSGEYSSALSPRQINVASGRSHSPISNTKPIASVAPSSPVRQKLYAAPLKHFEESVFLDRTSSDPAKPKYDRNVKSQNGSKTSSNPSIDSHPSNGQRGSVTVRSLNIDGPKEKDNNRTGTWSKSSKIVNSISAYFSSSVVRTSDDNGDIPMFSKLSPERTDADGKTDNLRRTFDSDIVPTNLSALPSWQKYPGSVGGEKLGSLPYKDEPDGDDDIVEILTKRTSQSESYEYAAATRFTLNTNKLDNIPRGKVTTNATANTNSRSIQSTHRHGRGSANEMNEQKEARQYLDI